MKKSLFALAALGVFASAAQAQSSVTLYGILDTAVGTVSNQYGIDPTFPASVNPYSATKATTSTTGMFNGGIQDSRWGLRGSEDLGGGLKANFQLESGLNLPTGQLNSAAGALVAANQGGNTANTVNNAANSSLDGQLFNRTAWVGLSDSKLGEIRVGKTYNFIYDTVVAFDPVQAAQLFSPLGFSGTVGGGGGASEKTRLDNSVTYKNKIGPVTVGAQYQFGTGINGSNTAGSSYGFMLGYETGPFAIQANYFNAVDALTAGYSATPNDVALTSQNLSTYMVAAKYKITPEVTVKAGYESIAVTAPTDVLTAAMIPSYFGYTTGAVAQASSAYTKNVNVYWIGGDYQITSALNLAVGYYDVATPSYSTTKAGDISTVSALLDYSFSKRTDVYAGLAYNMYNGDYYSVSNPTIASTNSIYAVGIRHKF
jgi:predicted porin